MENKLPVRSDLNIAILVLFAQARSFGATQITDVMVVNGLIKVSSGLWIIRVKAHMRRISIKCISNMSNKRHLRFVIV